MNDLGDLLAIDPSINSPGASLFRNGLLIASACIKVKLPKDAKSYNDAERCMHAADAVMQWVTKVQADPVAVAFEWPQIYDSDTPATANAVIGMAGVDMAITTACTVLAVMRKHGLDVRSYKPAEVWGQLPKSKSGSYWACARGKRVWSRLSELEQLATTDQHDAGDSVGIGLFALGRLGLRRTFATVRDH